MTTTPAQRKSRRLPQTESPEAAQAFLDYVRMGDRRNLEDLAAQYRSRTGPVPTRQLSRLKVWSTAFGWQSRITAALDEQAERELQEAARLDANTYNITSRELNKRAEFSDALKMDELIRMRESVRKPPVKGDTNVNVNVSLELQQMVERIAEEDGLTDDEKAELYESVMRHLDGAKA